MTKTLRRLGRRFSSQPQSRWTAPLPAGPVRFHPSLERVGVPVERSRRATVHLAPSQIALAPAPADQVPSPQVDQRVA